MNKPYVIAEAKQQSLVITTKSAERTTQLLNQLEGIAIKTNAQKTLIISLLKIIKNEHKELERERVEKVRPIQVAEKGIQDMFQPDKARYRLIEKIIKDAIVLFDQEQNRIREAAQEKLRLIAAEKERKEKEALAARAKKWEKKGNTDKSEALKEQAETVHVPVPIIQEPEKIKGTYTTKRWKARPANGAKEYDLEKIPKMYLLVNEALLNKDAGNRQGKFAPSGVEFYSEDSLSQRI